MSGVSRTPGPDSGTSPRTGRWSTRSEGMRRSGVWWSYIPTERWFRSPWRRRHTSGTNRAPTGAASPRWWRRSRGRNSGCTTCEPEPARWWTRGSSSGTPRGARTAAAWSTPCGRAGTTTTPSCASTSLGWPNRWRSSTPRTATPSTSPRAGSHPIRSFSASWREGGRRS